MSDWRRYDSHLIPAFHERFEAALGQGHRAVPGSRGPRGAASPRAVDQPRNRCRAGRGAHLDADDRQQRSFGVFYLPPAGDIWVLRPGFTGYLEPADGAPNTSWPSGTTPTARPWPTPRNSCSAHNRDHIMPAAREYWPGTRVKPGPETGTGPGRRSGPLPSRLRVRVSASAISSSTAAQVGVGHGRVVQCGGHHGAADQFAGEGRRGAFRPFRGGIERLRTEGDPAAVQFQQPDPLGLGRQRNFHGEVHPARALRQGPLQHVRPVGGEDECDVGVAVQPVHGVQHLEQQRLRPVAEAPVLGDQVAVLQHHDGRLERAGHAGGLGDPGE